MSENIYNRIAMLRAERGISRRQLAEALDVHYQTGGYLERGEYSPSLHLGLRIAAYFGVPGEGREHLTPPAGQRGQDRAVAALFRGPDPGPPGEVFQRPPQRPGVQVVRDAGGQVPLLGGLVPAARLGERLGQPPPGPGDLVDVDRPELGDGRLPLRGIVVAAGPAELRLGPGQPAAALRAEDEPGALGERRALPRHPHQLPGRLDLGPGGFLVA